MTTVACVLRSGGVYDPSWVVRLQRMCGAKNFVCLTDYGPNAFTRDVLVKPLWHDWPGWWSKIELFRFGLFSGPVVYIDLDSLVVAPIESLARNQHGFTMVKDFIRGKSGVNNSSVMSWVGDYSGIYEAFVEDPSGAMEQYRITKDKRVGDQAYIEDVLRSKNKRIDNFNENQVVSFKMKARNGPPLGSKIIQFHGKPKPHEADEEWVKKWMS